MGVHVILHFSKPIEQKTPRAASNVNYELDVITNLQGNVSSLAVTNVPLWWEIWMVGEAGAEGGRRRYVGNLLFFSLSFAVA